MRISSTFVLFALSFIFDGACAWWVAAARGIEPVILSFGAAFAALGLNDQPSHDVQLFDVKGWLKNTFKSESKDEASKDEVSKVEVSKVEADDDEIPSFFTTEEYKK